MFWFDFKPKPYRPWLRYPRTQQERRMWFAAPCYPEDVPHSEVKGRLKRSYHNLPTAYDDQFIHYQKCWKSLRKTRWKVIKNG